MKKNIVKVISSCFECPSMKFKNDKNIMLEDGDPIICEKSNGALIHNEIEIPEWCPLEDA